MSFQCGFFKRNRPPTERATYKEGMADEMYADSQVRYARPQMYSEERHGVKV